MSNIKRYADALESYADARDRAIIDSLTADSTEPFRAFIEAQRQLGILPPCFVDVSDKVLEISIRKMSLYCPRVPTELKGQAVEWLTSRGFDLKLD